MATNSWRLLLSALRDFQVSNRSFACFMEAKIRPALAESFQKSGAEERLSFSFIDFSSAEASKTPPDVQDFFLKFFYGIAQFFQHRHLLRFLLYPASQNL
jgi:hypothetical protein